MSFDLLAFLGVTDESRYRCREREKERLHLRSVGHVDRHDWSWRKSASRQADGTGTGRP